jgi:hypothetical protein
VSLIYAVDCVVHASRANDDDDPLAQPNCGPPRSSHHVHPQTNSHTAAALSRLVSLSPEPLSFSLSILAVIHSLSHYSLTNADPSNSSASDDSHKTSIVGRRIAFQPQPQGIHTVNGQITPDPYPVLVRFEVASPSYGIINTP